MSVCTHAYIHREALRRVYLDSDVRALPQLLQAPVMEKGENFSTGQKQLLCIGRALLRKSRIIIMVGMRVRQLDNHERMEKD